MFVLLLLIHRLQLLLLLESRREATTIKIKKILNVIHISVNDVVVSNVTVNDILALMV